MYFKHKYECIANEIQQKIMGGLYPNGILPREVDLAKQLNVSRGTVNAAMSLLASKGVIKRVKHKGTQVVGGDNGVMCHQQVALIMTNEGHFYSPMYQTVMECLQSRALFPICLSCGKTSETDVPTIRDRISRLLCSPFRGVIADGMSYWRWPFFNEALKHRIVFINCFDAAGAPPVGGVFADYEKAASLATFHLASVGHARIVFVRGRPTHPPVCDPEYRKNNILFQCETGYIRAMKECHLGHQEVIEMDQDGDAVRNMDLLRGILSRKERPTAILCQTDYYAVRVVITAGELGIRVPGDLAVIGMYNTPWCTESPVRLTSVSFEEQEIGRRSVERLVSEDNSRTVEWVEPKLIIRDSCGAK